MTVPTREEILNALRLVSEDPYMHKRITKEQAQSSGSTRYFTGKMCVNGHIAERLVTNGGCIACQRKTAGGRRDDRIFSDNTNHLGVGSYTGMS